MEELVRWSYCLIWFKDPDNLNVADSTVYVYYGNPAVSWSDNPSSTFEFFEGFDSKPTLGWNEWGLNGATLTATVSDSIVKVEQTPYGNPYGGCYQTSSPIWQLNQALRGRVKFGVLNPSYNAKAFSGDSTVHTDADEDSIGGIGQMSSSSKMCANNGDGLWVPSQPDSTNTNYQNFKTMELDWFVADIGRTPNIIVFNKHGGADETLLSTIYISQLPAYPKFGLCTTDYMQGDWVLIRRFVYPEPVQGETGVPESTNYIVAAVVMAIVVILATRDKKKRR